jgi:RHS repeat-associated protein
MKSCFLGLCALVLIAWSQAICAQSYQWSAAQGGGLPEWATTWRDSPGEVAKAYCDVIGAPQNPGQINGSYTQSCYFAVNANGWPAGNIHAVRINQTNCTLPSGCQQTKDDIIPTQQLLTRPVPDQYFVNTESEDPAQCDCPDNPPLPPNVVADPIDPVNGSVVKIENDLKVGGSAVGFNRFYSSRVGSSDMGTGWTHSFSRRIVIKYQSFDYKTHLLGNVNFSSLHLSAGSACTSGFTEIKNLVGTWQNATATFSGNVCTLSVGGTTIGKLRVFSSRKLNPFPSSTIVALEALRDDGQIVRFPVEGGSIVAPPSVKLRLESTSGGFTLKDDVDNLESYDATGRLVSITSRSGVVRTLGYDASLQLSTVTDSFGHTFSLGYDLLNRVKTLTDAGGRVVQYGYDPQGRLVSVSSGDGTSRTYQYENATYPKALTGLTDESETRLSTWGYDTQGRANSTQEAGGAGAYTLVYNTNGTVTATDALGAIRTFTVGRYGDISLVTAISGLQCPTCVESAATTYDSAGFPSTRTDYNGNITTYIYNSRGLQTSRTEAYGTPRARTITTDWHPTFRLPTLITEANRTTSFTHYANGNVFTRTVTDTTVGPPVSRTWTYAYNSFGKVLTEDGPRTDVSDVTTYTYYSCTTGYQCGQVNTITNAAGHVTTFNSYNAHGQPTQITDPNGLVISLAYDSRQRITDHCSGGTLPGCSGGELTHLTYWPTGLLKRVTNPNASFLEYTYDAAHRLTQIQDGDFNKIVYTPDAMGNRTAENVYDPSNALKRTHTRVFNTLNQLWKDVGAAGTANVTTIFGYDNNGNTTTINAPMARNSTISYDELNRLKQVTDPNTGITQFGHDANDNLTSVTDPRTLVTSYTYTGFGDLKTQTSPDTGLTTNVYDSSGNLSTSTDSRGAITTYTYDNLNRVKTAAFKIGATTDQTYTYIYDGGTNQKGRLTGATDGTSALAWTYDLQGRVTGKGQTFSGVTGGLSIGYGYNAQGQLFHVVLPSGKAITYGYNSNGQISSVTLDGSPSTTILNNATYDPFGPMTSWAWGNGITETRTFDTDGKLTNTGSSSSVVGNRTFGYDDAFRIVSTTDSATGGPSWTLGYDILDRLNSAAKSGTTIGYTYDANGNRLTQTGTAASTYTVSSTSNRLSSVSGALARTYAYNNSGSVTSSSATTHTYYNSGRMKTAKLGAASVTTYVYNALGQRVKKSGGAVPTAVYFAYDEAGHLVGEYNISGSTVTTVQETVWLGDIPIATLRGTSVFYVHTDQLNTPRKVTNTSNVLRWIWDPTPFGQGTPTQNPGGQPNFVYNLRYPGQLFDGESNLNYNYFRDYDPSLGRYIESDPIALLGGTNTYAYSIADPIGKSDPSGLIGPQEPSHANAIESAIARGDYAQLRTLLEAAQSLEEEQALRAALSNQLRSQLSKETYKRIVSNSETMFRGNRINKVEELCKKFGGKVQDWYKKKGFDSAGNEYHWYENNGVKVGLKLAGELDPF